MISGSNEDDAMTTQGVWDSYQARTPSASHICHGPLPMTLTGRAAIISKQQSSINSSPAGYGHVREPGTECGL